MCTEVCVNGGEFDIEGGDVGVDLILGRVVSREHCRRAKDREMIRRPSVSRSLAEKNERRRKFERASSGD